MPSTSPGTRAPSKASTFAQILPGAPVPGLQSLTSFTFNWKRYVAYVSGSQLSILSAPTVLIQALTFDRELVAVATEIGKSGKIAVACASDVWVLEPETHGWESVRWEKALLLRAHDAADELRTLCWGSESGELLVGGSHMLSLFNTLPSSRANSPAASPVDGEDVEERKPLWSKAVSSPVQHAVFCPSANLIASCGARDRLVKIWRRLSFEEGLFDYAYLSHPAAVTQLEWRPVDGHAEERRGSGISSRHDEEAEVLYTIASDGVLRVWRTGGLHDLEILVLHTTVDLVSSIPQSPTLTSKGVTRVQKPARYTFILPAQDFCAAVSAKLNQPSIPAVQTKGTLNHAMEHLKEVSSKSPDVIVTLDGRGRMSAWGLQSVGHKRRPESPGSSQAFHICHCEDFRLKSEEDANARFLPWFEDGKLVLLSHSFNGELDWWSGDVGTLFATSGTGLERLQKMTAWTGHSAPIAGMRALEDGLSLFTWSQSGGIVRWKQDAHGTLEREATISIEYAIRQAALLGPADGILAISDDSVLLLSDSGKVVSKASHGFHSSGQLVRISDDTRKFDQHAKEGGQHWLLLGSEGRCSKLTITAAGKMTCSPPYALYRVNGTKESALHVIIARHPQKPDSRRIVAINAKGVLTIHSILAEALATPSTTELSESGTSFATGLTVPGILDVSDDFASLASKDGKEMIILDLSNGYQELHTKYEQPVKQLCFFSTQNKSHDGAMLAVAFVDRVEVLASKHYERRSELPTWAHVKQISVADLGLGVKTVQWLADGKLALAAGNGLMISEHFTDAAELHPELRDRFDHTAAEKLSLQHVTRHMKRSLPVWHPRFVSRLARHGKLGAIFSILRTLEHKLKFWSEGEHLSHSLELDHQQLIAPDLRGAQNGLDEGTWSSLNDLLDEKDLPATSQAEQQRLKRVVEALQSVQEHTDALDANAMRYLLNWKMQLSHMTAGNDQACSDQPNGKLTNGRTHTAHRIVPVMAWREIAFAYHSATQQPLLDILIGHYDNKLTWSTASRLGITSWIREIHAPQTEGNANASLEQILSNIAQEAYRSTSPPDPVNGALFFLALRQKARLLALWRIATWHREQRSTMNFLKKDFSQPEAKTAAKKNAYALMGKRRFEYAAAFFLLAEDAQSAVSVLAMQCHDIGLAIGVARMYDGDGSACLMKLLQDRIMPTAEKQGDRWCMSWCHSVMENKHDAACALVKPLNHTDTGHEEPRPVRQWEQDDPATLLLYRHIRTSNADPEQEYQAVLRAARVLRRMGLILLALEMVSQWQFAQPQQHQTVHEEEPAIKPTPATVNGTTEALPSMLDSFTAPAVQPHRTDTPSILDGFTMPEPAKPAPTNEKSERGKKAAELMAKLKAKKEQSAAATLNEKKPEPTQFKEPDANSLLDSFAFESYLIL